jgi:hypothetical protein
MNIDRIIVTILTSAFISSIVAFLFRFFFENKQNQKYIKTIEELKHEHEMKIIETESKYSRQLAELKIKLDVDSRLFQRKFELYPIIFESIYRSRDMAREITKGNFSEEVIRNFRSNKEEVQNYLRKYSLDLMRDGVMEQIHEFKCDLYDFDKNLKKCENKTENRCTYDELRKTCVGIELLFQKLKEILPRIASDFKQKQV